MSNPVISTVILNWNRSDLLAKALKSYIDTITVQYEMFVVDNASTDDSRTVIESFRARNPHCQPIYMTENLAGEAINVALERCRGAIIHIGENDVEYLPGWSEKAVDYFEVFPELGQLSLFSPFPPDGHVGRNIGGRLVHRSGRILYEADGNVVLSSCLRRDLIDRGIRIHNEPECETPLPDDGALSEAVKQHGFMVARADHPLANNLGFFASEIQSRPDYYRANYLAKSWRRSITPESVLDEYYRRPVTGKRGSFLFPDKQVSPEGADACPRCPHPRLWSMFDRATPDVETVEFLFTLTRLVKPGLVIQSPAWIGITAAAIGAALSQNGVGRLVAIDPDPECVRVASEFITARGLGPVVDVIHERGFDFVSDLIGDLSSDFISDLLRDLIGDGKIDLLILNPTVPAYASQLDRLVPKLAEFGLIAITPVAEREPIEAGLASRGANPVLHLHTPRGMVLGQRRP
ncbi:MAG TPA: glycosyltransferase [Blastocatellia bacterium]